MSISNQQIKEKLGRLYDELFGHDGYGRIEVDMKILRRGQKEIILRCGKEYRFVVDYPGPARQQAGTQGKVTAIQGKASQG